MALLFSYGKFTSVCTEIARSNPSLIFMIQEIHRPSQKRTNRQRKLFLSATIVSKKGLRRWYSLRSQYLVTSCSNEYFFVVVPSMYAAFEAQVEVNSPLVLPKIEYPVK